MFINLLVPKGILLPYRSEKQIDVFFYCHNPNRAKQSFITWSDITVGKLTPHHTTTTTPTMCPFTIQIYSSYSILCQLYCTSSYEVIRCRRRSLAIYGCYHSIPGEILSHFYVRKSSESPILTILEAL